MTKIDPTIIHEAAILWCGQKERETFPSDVEYFKQNWRFFPGLRAFVDTVLEKQL